MDRLTLEDFKYSYSSANKSEKTELVQSVLLYPERFDMEVSDYVSYLWNKYYNIYLLVEVDEKEVMDDDKYQGLSYEKVSEYMNNIFFKITDSFGEEIGQGMYDYLNSSRVVNIRYLEFIKPPKHQIRNIMQQIFMNKYSEDVVVRYAF